MTTEQMAKHIELLKCDGKTDLEIRQTFNLSPELFQAMLEKYAIGANDNEKK